MLWILIHLFSHLDVFIILEVDGDLNGNGDVEVKIEEETPKYEILEEEEGEEKLINPTTVETEEEEKKLLKVEKEEEEKVFKDDEEEQMDSGPEDVLDSCVVKYSVKTTPFLQR